MAKYTIRHTSGDGDMHPVSAKSLTLAKAALKDHDDLDLFYWSTKAERYYCEAILRDGVWLDGYGYGS